MIKHLLDWFLIHKPARVEVLEELPQSSGITFVISPHPIALFYLEEWCKRTGYTDIQGTHDRVWYAIPPREFIPVPLCKITEVDYRAWIRTSPNECPCNVPRGTFWTNPTLREQNGIPPGGSGVWNGSEWVNVADYWNR